MVIDQVARLLYPPGATASHEASMSPHARLWQMVLDDKEDLILICIYTMFSGIFSLSLPLATQIIVNTIAAGVFMQPLIVVSTVMLGGLIFVAGFRLLTLWLAEIIRQRTFVRVALRLAYRVPRIRHSVLSREYLPELVNRFFDTITLQGGWFNFLLDFPAACLQLLVGLTLLAIYSPWFLLFDLIVLAFFLFSVLILGYGGYRTRSNETTQRFRVAQWLEELAHCETGLKMNGIPLYLLEHTDRLLDHYVGLRNLQFKVLLRQAVGLYFTSNRQCHGRPVLRAQQ